MRPIYATQTGPGKTAWLPLDLCIPPNQVGLYTKVTGAAQYTIEYTDEDPFQSGGVPADASANIFEVPGMVDEIVGMNAQMPGPARAVRINQKSGAGSTRLSILTAGIANSN